MNAYVETLLSTENLIELEKETCKIVYDLFSNYSLRLKTFNGFPIKYRQSPQKFSEAGFLYTHNEDRVICFSCGGGLYQWNPEHDPWEQHAFYYPNCDFVKEKKGISFIQNVAQKYSENK